MKNSLRGYIVPLVLTIVLMIVLKSVVGSTLVMFGGPGFTYMPFPVQVSPCGMAVNTDFEQCHEFYIWWGIAASVLTALVSFYLFNRFKNWITRIIIFFSLFFVVLVASCYITNKYIPIVSETPDYILPPLER